MNEEYKTIAEVAEHFDVTDTAVRKWISRGNIQTATRREVGKRPTTVLFISDVEDFLRPGIEKTAAKMN